MQMKAMSNRLREQCVAGHTTGTILISDEAKKTIEESDRIQNHIVSLEKMAAEGVDVSKTLATLRADLAKQKPKLPKTFQTLEDQAKAIEAVKECREKQASVEKTLQGQRTKAQETQLQIAEKLQTDLEELEKTFQDKKKMFTESAEDRRQHQETIILDTGKRLAKLEEESDKFCADLKPLTHPVNGMPHKHLPRHPP